MCMLKMTNISKAFFGVTVLNHVDFTVQPAEVHALLGENGAGKSTLMNILAGVHLRDSGTVEFNGKELENTTVKISESAGIAFVHQELNLFNDLKVYENIFLRKELLTKLGTLDKKTMIQKALELFDSLGVDIDPTASVSDLEPSKKQMLEIAKALFANAELLILDEPTTALNNNEIEHLFTLVRKLKQSGKSFIFISHKMNEIFTIADRYTVLRNGNFIKCGLICETTPEEVTRLMVGNSYSESSVYESRELGEPVLELENLCGEGFHNISLSVRRGEILGLTGLKGAGVSEMMQAVFGVRPITNGVLRVEGEVIQKNHIHRAMKAHVAMIASNRKENSIIPDFSLLENNYISEHTLSAKRQYIRKRAEIRQYSDMCGVLNIKANSHEDLITSLSGGNQQKVILARWLTTRANILLMDNPTQGIDVGAKAEIYKLILALAAEGKTILVNTLELPEIQKIADRCVVFYHGNIQAILPREEITEERVMLYATNVLGAMEERNSDAS
ncbi:MAG: sugar ABC transporter ATP-binding protein [Clostridium sp.]|uniref:sugar ABC transporter ATP-binding protein n=1 Tax=Clostridium sp. TaxID=1506 RepID=UPI00290F892A|nr:sugar ABC transporter ATP-binding protein [Clostridium sp.]MDU7337675.1 sugar ABC transporter ATP-binding protein [Clostridium sp.]